MKSPHFDLYKSTLNTLKIFPAPAFLNFSSAAVDFSSEGLRFIDFDHDQEGLKLARFSFMPIAEANLIESSLLKDALKKLPGKKTKFIQAIIPEESSYLFVTPLETADASSSIEQAREEIEFHIEENVPLPTRSILFDHHAFSEAGKPFAAVNAISIDTAVAYENLLKDVGMSALSFMTLSVGLSKCLIKKGEWGISLIVHLNNDKTVIVVVKDGVVRFSSTLQFGGALITDAIAKYRNISREEAEKIKEKEGFSMDTEDHNAFLALGNAISIIRDEIERVIISWHARDESLGPIGKIILSGTNALIPGLLEYVTESLRLPVEKGNAWINFPRYENEVPIIPYKDSLGFAPLIGLFVN